MTRRKRIQFAVAVALLLLAVVLLGLQSGEPPPLRQGTPTRYHFYFDLRAGALFVAPSESLPPIEALAGGPGVRAYVYTCGQCTEDQRRVGYLEALTPEAAEAARQLRQPGIDEATRLTLQQTVQRGTLVARPPETEQTPRWVSRADPRGAQITQAFRTMCDGEPARICTPDRRD